jgi:plasmid stabilization system protein ParE
MRATFHRLVQKDVWGIIRHYETVSGERLADEFYEEFLACVALANRHPERYHFDASGLRRANLSRFPYRVRTDSIFILVLRHHHRRPSFGLRRES